MLSIADLNFAYDDTEVFRQLNFSLQCGDLIHLIGENGAGKTTLMKLIAGLYPLTSGAIKLTKPKGFQERMAFFSLTMGFHPELTVRQNICFFPIAVATNHIELELKQLQLLHKLDVIFSHLSLGQQQKIVLATLKHIDAALWLLDEPFANLDKHGEDWLWTAIDEQVQKGGAVIFTTHQSPNKLGMGTWQII